MRDLMKRLAKAETAVAAQAGDSNLKIVFVKAGADEKPILQDARRTYTGQLLVVRFIESDRAVADLPEKAVGFIAGGPVLQ